MKEIYFLVNKFRVMKKTIVLKTLGIYRKTDISEVYFGIENEIEFNDKFKVMKRLTESETFFIQNK